jgi:DNA-binding PadR family transcriptional regulator
MDVLLGLLAIEPMSGYDLGQTIRDSVGHFWNESYGQIYPNLKKLKADGLVNSKLERQKGKPDRHIYSITKKGRERLAAWLAVPPQSEVPRNELLLKLFFGEQASPQLLIGYLEKMAEQEGAFLNKLKQIRKEIAKNSRYPGAPYWAMAARFGEFEMKAHLRWAEETLAELQNIAGKQQSRTEVRKEKKHAGK